MTPRRFLTAAALLYFTAIAVIGGVSALIDPYDLIHTPDPNHTKPFVLENLLLHKAAAVARVRPEAVILGSSRAGHGLVPPAAGGMRVYNLAVPGASPYQMRRLLQHAHAIHPIRLAVAGIDLFTFNRHYLFADLDESLLATDTDGRPQPLWRLRQFLLPLSWDLVSKGLESLHTATPAIRLYPLGNWETIPAGGTRAAFLDNERTYLTTSWFPPPGHRFELDEGAFEAFAELLRFARREGTELKLFLSPVHARQWEAADAAGLWPQVEEWRRRVTAIAAREQTPLWDFAGYNSVTTEPLPRGEDDPPTRGYQESSHYHPSTGERVLHRLFDYGEPPPPDFGVRLTPANLESRIAAIRAAREAYRQRFPADVEEIRRLAAETAPQRRQLVN
ncbi:hypothetical protein [Endothiovibrio diazotrophicus]